MATPVTPVAAAAPVSAPVTPAAPVTPVTPAAPAAVEITTPATPVTPETPAAVTPASDAPKVAPKFEDFDSNEDYMAAKFEYEDKNGLLDQPAVTGNEIDPNAVVTDPVADVSAEPADPDAPVAAPVIATPEVMAGWMEAHPEFKAALDAVPEVKESLFSMARENAKAAPVLEIFPDVASAQDANKTAGNFVELLTAFQMSAEDPASFPEAFSKFEDLFRLRDEKGEYLRDAAGNIRVGEDFNLLGQHIVGGFLNGTLAETEQSVKTIQQRLDSAVYPSAESRAADERALEEAELDLASARRLSRRVEGGGEAKPDLSKIADPEVRAYYEKKEAELEEQRKALGQDKAQTATSARKAIRAKYETEYRGKFGASSGTRIATLVKEKLDAGSFIPSYVLEARHKDPASGVMVPSFAVGILDEFNAKTGGNSVIRGKRAKLQLLKPSPEALAQRLQYEDELREQYLPGIVDKAVAKVQAKEKADRATRQQGGANRGNVAEVEPRSGTTPQPRTMTEEQVASQAQETVKKMPGYDSMSPAEVNTAVLSEKFRLKYGGGK